MGEIVLELKSIDFKNSTDYSDWTACALANAARRQFNAKHVWEAVDHIKIDGHDYSHREFGGFEYLNLKSKSVSSPDDETLTKIILTLCE